MCCCIISSLRYKEMSCTTHYFFFSSRRRHTRSLRDWSSDVCSSDLQSLRRCPQRGRLRPDLLRQQRPALGAAHVRRSEERRVGKGVDSRGRRSVTAEGVEERARLLTGNNGTCTYTSAIPSSLCSVKIGPIP